jgi:3-hydroxymyristoyl/3-hydroxydecanoyl-(acyl carrier protein) dehydratase
MIVPKQKIENYIPQRYPFIMIDNLIEASADMFKTDFAITEENIFVDNGYLREFALIENIAQTSSAGLAITKQYSTSVKPDGYLGGISRLKLYQLPKVNDTIYTVVNLLVQLENMFLVKGINYVNGKMLMECELKLAGMYGR